MKQVSIETFAVSGSSIRTNNKAEASSSGKIPDLWREFYTSHPNPDKKVYGVYSNYESDATEEFTVTVGTRGDAEMNSGVSIESGTYLAFPANGSMPAAIINAWKTVWEHFSLRQPYARAYETDFEEYNGPESATIFIGIKTSS